MDTMPLEAREPEPRDHAQGQAGRLRALPETKAPSASELERLEPRLVELAWRLLGDVEQARDVAQTALLRAWDKREGFEGRAAAATWLRRIVINLCRDAGRRARTQGDALAGLRRETSDIDEVSTAQRAAANESARRVEQAVRSLPEGEREVLVLRHYEDLAFPAIAALLGDPVTTIKSRAARGLARLRQRLKDLE